MILANSFILTLLCALLNANLNLEVPLGTVGGLIAPTRKPFFFK